MAHTLNIPKISRPMQIMLKPAGASCNLRCDYCYYLQKKNLYPEATKFSMSDKILDDFTREYIGTQLTDEILFTWHGGETLLRDISFYRRAVELQKQYAGSKTISNCIQTNGTLLNDEWCEFFKENNFLVGISIDGPQHCHDHYRKTSDGRPSFQQVMRGIELLKKHGVEFNAMAVVNNYNVRYPLEFYNFFKSIGCQFIQFTPIVEMMDGKPASWNVPSGEWGNFLITIFDEWIKRDVGQIFVQYFDSTLANWVGIEPGVCTLAKYCGHNGVLEFNGDLYSCDHFVFPDNQLGNISNKTLISMMYSKEQERFGMAKFQALPSQCQRCRFLFACNGECPKNRIISTTDGESGLNYLCEGYFKFFEHVEPYMNFMKNELKNHRSPANVMRLVER